MFLKSLIGLLRPERGKIMIDGTDIIQCSAKELYEIRTLFGVMFQDGALFGSMNIYDNTAFRCVSTRRRRKAKSATSSWKSSRWWGLMGAENKFPGRDLRRYEEARRPGLPPVLDPRSSLVDEADSGLDPVRTAYLSQLLIDINVSRSTPRSSS